MKMTNITVDSAAEKKTKYKPGLMRQKSSVPMTDRETI